jgi:hypothetical protein
MIALLARLTYFAVGCALIICACLLPIAGHWLCAEGPPFISDPSYSVDGSKKIFDHQGAPIIAISTFLLMIAAIAGGAFCLHSFANSR